MNYAAEFSVSPIPWVTASKTPACGVVMHLDFENVASSFMLKNVCTGSQVVAVGWSSAGVTGSHRITVAGGESVSADLRFKRLYLMAVTGSTVSDVVDYELLVGLTGIPSRFFPELSGSGYNGVG